MISAAVLTTSVSVLGAETGAESSVQSEGETVLLSGKTAEGDAETAETSQSDQEEKAVSPTEAPVRPTVAPTAAPTTVPAEPTSVPTEPTAAPEDPTVTPTVTPAEPTVTPEVTPTEAPENPVVTPTVIPDEPSVMPTVTPTVAPEPSKLPAKVQKIIDRIDALSLSEITISDEKEIKSVRKAYDALSKKEKKLVTNYTIFVNMEEKLAEITQKDSESAEDVTGLKPGQTSVIEGNPLYITDMISNLHAGKNFYLNSLSDLYHLSFSDDFASVMEEIEEEYKAANQLHDASDADGVTSSEDAYLVRNWQDILAVYVYRQSQAGKESFTLDASCKAELAEIFAEMNPLVADETDSSKLVYANYHINYYIKAYKIAKEDREILKKYTETDCSLLCAVVTGARGFVRQSVGDDVSEERVNVITAAYSLIGKVGYFWGGKYASLGENSSWGTVMQVTAEDSKSTGTYRAYGLDCSGFVTWSVINGYRNTGLQSAIGDGTTEQWLKAEVVSEADAKPGDLVFQDGPEAGVNNHVGIICGKTDAGDWIVVHCSAGQNGITVGEAYGAGFRYIRRPTVYETVKGQEDSGSENTPDLTFLENLTAENSLAELPAADAEETEVIAGPLVTADNGVADGQSDTEAGQTVLTQDEDKVKQALSGITVKNALTSLKTGGSRNETESGAAVPDTIMTEPETSDITETLSEVTVDTPDMSETSSDMIAETPDVKETLSDMPAGSSAVEMAGPVPTVSVTHVTPAIPKVTVKNALMSLPGGQKKSETVGKAAGQEASAVSDLQSFSVASQTEGSFAVSVPVGNGRIRTTNALLSIHK